MLFGNIFYFIFLVSFFFLFFHNSYHRDPQIVVFKLQSQEQKPYGFHKVNSLITIQPYRGEKARSKYTMGERSGPGMGPK